MKMKDDLPVRNIPKFKDMANWSRDTCVITKQFIYVAY